MERNTTLPHPVGLRVNVAPTREGLLAREPVEERVWICQTIKGDIKVVEVKVLHQRHDSSRKMGL